MIETFGWPGVQFLLRATVWTLALSGIAFVLGGVVGLALALGRTLGPAPLRVLVAGYIELVQATPLLVVVFLSYFGLSFLGIFLPALVAAALALTVYASAYLADIWRGCIQAIPRTQWEAADALALTGAQRLRYVILPQAMRIALGPTVGFMVQIVKNTSVTALIGFVELTRAGQLLNNRTFQPFEVFGAVALIYFALCFPLSLLSEKLKEKKSAVAAH